MIFCRELDSGFTHAENLHIFIEDALKASGITPRDLTAIAVSKGPGSYTGLRIGVSTAKGLAYALNIPLISVDTLRVMSASAKEIVTDSAFYCPMIDARRMEVYTAVYDVQLNQHLPVEALIVDERSIEKFKSYTKIYFFGDGMSKCREILQNLSNAVFIENIVPSAKHMCALSYQKFIGSKFEDVAYFEPFYLKDFLIPGKKIS